MFSFQVRRPRYTIGQVMVLIAVLGVLLAMTRLNALETIGPMVAIILATMGLGLMLDTLLERWLGVRCPTCNRWKLRRLARSTVWKHYYKCLQCDARYKRQWFGPFQPANDPDDSGPFEHRTTSGTWHDAQPAEVDDSTCGTLLGHKLDRLGSDRDSDS